MNGQAKEQQLQPHDAYIVEERELDEEEEEENDDDSKDSGSAGASSMEDLAKPRGMSVLVCGQPFEHRSQSARRRIKSAQLRHSEQDTVKLAGVKHELYNPALPSLRRMEMDDVGQRLAHEHSRATSALTRSERISFVAVLMMTNDYNTHAASTMEASNQNCCRNFL